MVEAYVVERLSERQKDLLKSIHPRFGVKDIFRPNEGESHGTYTALVRLGLLEKRRCGDFPMIYWLTEAGVAARATLERAQAEGEGNG